MGKWSVVSSLNIEMNSHCVKWTCHPPQNAGSLLAAQIMPGASGHVHTLPSSPAAL